MNIMLELAYDGTAYHGWQRQNNALSVCEVLEGAIEKILKQKASVTGCSRTDAGVHALRYVCNFRAETAIPMEKLPAALHTKLPRDIRIYRAGPKYRRIFTRGLAPSLRPMFTKPAATRF